MRLQAQPALVFAILLQHAGEIVTRESLQQQVWADGTQVDFERGLNYCIAQVRAALGDSADSPRFVRTIPKKGYQFIAPVEGGKTLPPPQPPQKRMDRRAWLAISSLPVAAGIWFLLSRSFEAPRPIIAVCLFDNETGEAGYDRIASGFSDALTAELALTGAKSVQVIGNAQMLRAPRPERDLQSIHTSLGAEYVVVGQVQNDSSEIRVLAHLLRMPKQIHSAVERLDGMSRFDSPLEIEKQFAQRASERFLKAVARNSSAAPGR